ncbi:MAG: competence/damage-inducible protein A [Tissierellales bacterium]|nr:competence/damage-inducible protein A [Tissierellales bacterium]MBN2827313.1 competence/damage-inducible protein A [Tissierellales bacterium]
MNAEILCFGTEILHGDIANTNAQYISKQLAAIGINVYYHSVVGDNHVRMEEAFRLAFTRADLVICTGGLGPTQDDITKEILAKYYQVDMTFDEESFEHVKGIYKRLNREMPESNIRQAYFPRGSIVLHNPNGTANGCIFERKGKVAVLMPGPPFEMIPMLDSQVVPYLMKFSEGVIMGEKYIVTGVGESAVEAILIDLINNQTNPTIATFAGKGRVVVRVTAKAPSQEEAKALIHPIDQEIRIRLGNKVYPADTAGIEEYASQLLLTRQLTVAVAESCTGGLVASKLISFPGMSASFLEGFITYSNHAKAERLGVRLDILNHYGAVSPQTAEEMARGVAFAAKADVGLATTGIAGPSGATEGKPVGLVYIAVYYQGKTEVRELNYPGQRASVMERAAIAVLDLMNKIIAKN